MLLGTCPDDLRKNLPEGRVLRRGSVQVDQARGGFIAVDKLPVPIQHEHRIWKVVQNAAGVDCLFVYRHGPPVAFQ